MERLAQARADSINKEIFLQRNVEKKMIMMKVLKMLPL